MFGNLQIGKGGEQFTKIFVHDVALFCALEPNLQPFLVMWGIG